MKMGPEKSEVLVLGVSDGSGGTIPLTTEKRVDNGECVF
jgi:tRNA-binding protein